MKRRQTGFTLVELIITMTILGILTAMAVPSFREFTLDNRVGGTHSDLVGALNVARMESLRRGVQVVVCTSTDKQTCSESTSWANGWIVFNDINASGNIDADNEAVLQTWEGPGGAAAAITVGSSTNLSRVRYQPTGMITPAVASTFTVQATGCVGQRVRQLELSPTGSLRSTRAACP